MAGPLLGISARAFLAASKVLGKTGLTFSPMLLGDYVLNDSKITKAAAAKGWQGILHPIDTFNRVKGVIDEKKQTVEDIKRTAADLKQKAGDVLETGTGVVTGDREALARAADAAKKAGKTLKGKAGEVFESVVNGKDKDNDSEVDHEESGWGKKLGWLAAMGGSSWLAKTLFFGGKKDKKDKEDSGFGFGTLIKSALTILAVVTAVNYFKLGEKFEMVKGKLFGEGTPTVAQQLNSDPTGRTVLLSPASVDTTLVVNTPPANPSVVARSFEAVQNDAALRTQTAIKAAKTPVAAKFDVAVTPAVQAESDALMARMRTGQPNIAIEETLDHG